jgi:putative FmdB family regulatory protein
MPLREYVCTKCGHCFERLFKTHAADAAAKHNIGDICPKCGYIAHRLTSKTAPPRFEGSGFHSTDYK